MYNITPIGKIEYLNLNGAIVRFNSIKAYWIDSDTYTNYLLVIELKDSDKTHSIKFNTRSEAEKEFEQLYFCLQGGTAKFQRISIIYNFKAISVINNVGEEEIIRIDQINRITKDTDMIVRLEPSFDICLHLKNGEVIKLHYLDKFNYNDDFEGLKKLIGNTNPEMIAEIGQ